MSKRLLVLCLLALATLARAQTPTVSMRTVADKVVKQPDWSRRMPSPPTSPDGRWKLRRTAVEGLDVTVFRIALTASDVPDRVVCERALEATFSPDSRWLFLATGPSPILYDLKTGSRLELREIQSGLETLPVWVHHWSQDHRSLVLHQQARFDQARQGRVYTITLP